MSLNSNQDAATFGRRRYWCATYHMGREFDGESGEQRFRDFFNNAPGWPRLTYICGQLERGTDTGRLHWQLYVEFDAPRSLTDVRKCLSTAHWEPRRGTQQEACDYCTKTDTRVSGPFEFGTRVVSNQGKRSDLNEIRDLINNGATMASLCQSHFGQFLRYNKGFQLAINTVAKKRCRTTELWILSGLTGSGKSWSASEIGGPDAYWKTNNHKWWDGYDPSVHDTVIIDDFRDSDWPLQLILRLCDRYPLRLETKGGHVEFASSRVIITSPSPFTHWYAGCDFDLSQLRRRVTRSYSFVADEQGLPFLCKILKH